MAMHSSNGKGPVVIYAMLNQINEYAGCSDPALRGRERADPPAPLQSVTAITSIYRPLSQAFNRSFTLTTIKACKQQLGLNW